MDPIVVTIGGEHVLVPPIMTFPVLKRAWPAIKALGEVTDPIDQATVSIRIIAAALSPARPDLTAEVIESRIGIIVANGQTELAGLIAAVRPLLQTTGLVPLGEAVPPAGASSTATSTG